VAGNAASKMTLARIRKILRLSFFDFIQPPLSENLFSGLPLHATRSMPPKPNVFSIGAAQVDQ
jgi:hypothetical protein